MGCLIRQPGLFQTATLSDGRSLDEAITPADFVTPLGRDLYQMIYQPLVDGRELSLTGLLARFAQDGEQKLAELTTDIDRELDEMIAHRGGDPATILRAAGDEIARHHQQRQYQEEIRPTATSTSASDTELRRAFEAQKAQQSSLKIMRVDH